MSKKEVVALTGAITTIVVGAFYVLSAILWFTIYRDVSSEMESKKTLLLVIIILNLVAGAALIVLSSIFCAKRKAYGFAIVLIILHIILTGLQIADMAVAGKAVAIKIVLVIIGFSVIDLFIAYFKLKHKIPEAAETALPMEPTDKQRNLALLKRLREQGDLTEEEYKAMLFKEIEK